MSKRARSQSPLTCESQESSESCIHPTRAFKRRRSIADLDEWAKDLKDTVNRMIPTGGRRYDQAAIFVVRFSESDIPEIEPLRDELLEIFEKTYNWKVEKYTIDVSQVHQVALQDLNLTIVNFFGKHGSRSKNIGSLSCIYYSGHGVVSKRDGLTICSSLSKGRPDQPYLHWDQLALMNAKFPREHRLLILDCCVSGLASLTQNNIEVLGASAWESKAASNLQACFTRALIDELKSLNGDSISTTQLISRLHCLGSVRRGMSMPIHKGSTSDQPPALIHRIEATPELLPLRQVTSVPKYAHVLISVRVTKKNTVPSAEQWDEWLDDTNLPPQYIEQIDIIDKRKVGSRLVIFVVPIEIWLGLPDKRAYSFVDYHYDRDFTA